MAAELIAGAFLSSFFQFAFERLASSDFKDLFHKGLVEKLEITLNSINQLLDDAETKQYQNQNVKNWLDQLKHEVYEVDQLLDEIATNVQRKSKVRSFLSAKTNHFASRIKDLQDRLEHLANQNDRLGLKEGRCARNELEVGPKSSIRIPMTSLVDESSICGRKGDKEKIINFLLLDNGSSNHAPIISIVGLGGMGKTTLAQLVYNDDMIQKSFDLKAWVNVSESFDVVGLTKAILESFGSSPTSENKEAILESFGCSPTSENLEAIHKSFRCSPTSETLQRQLQESLTGKKYLLVLDDVWNGNVEIWDHLLLPLNKGSSGSKIIVTTRDRGVATSMKSSMLLDLERLDESDCWSLFVKLAFHNRNVSEYPILESIGKNIVDKCGGLPLAVKTLGNLLQKKFSESQWEKILETNLWCLSAGDSTINPVLRLSYHNLPSNMKRCFAYCSIFPKGYEFEKNTLINLWKAEGLLNCCRGDTSGEELDNELFNDLESISFIQRSLDSEYYKMHELVNDLAKSESRKFCLQIDSDMVQDICEKTRHIWFSLDLNDDARMSKQICKIKGLRSLLIEKRVYDGRHIISNNLQRDIFSKLKYLRMLSFRGCELIELVDEIGNLKLLRYLDLTSTEITSLPDSISELYNLETLILEGNDINKMPKKIGRLNNLQTLSHFVVAEKRGCDIKELGNLNLLHGKLCISGMEHVIDPADAAKANMKGKKHLEELNVNFGGNFNNNGRELDVLEALEPNSNLKKLTIENYNGNCFPSWLMDCHLPNLVALKLNGCGLCSHLPSLGQLHSLQKLELTECNKLEECLCLDGTPFLKELYISKCPKLKRAPLPQHLPSLQKLKIDDCEMLEISIPKGDSMIELVLQRCDRILVNELPTSLKTFVLKGNRYTAFSVEQTSLNCNFLENFSISFNLHCNNLSIRGWLSSSSSPFSLHLFNNLQDLWLFDFPQLESFPRGCLPSNLRELGIYNCPKLIASREKWGLFQLNSLKILRVSDEFENVESFPEENLLPPTLEYLDLMDCSKLRIMNYKGFLHLNSLGKLCIWKCPCLESLPEKSLPSSLSRLRVEDCPLITKKYRKEGGERWHTICHIPNVCIHYIEQHE